MYTEEPRNEINWGSLFKKVAIVVIVVVLLFLIFWLLIRNNGQKTLVNVNNNGTNGTGNNSNSSLQESYYSNDFIENYRYFHDTAKEYFLISNLPDTGKSLKFTLKELIDKGLLLPFGYNNQACDLEASYALVTNINGDYTMTITLVCGKEVGKTNEELGCNQLCTNGSCTETPSNKPSNNTPTPSDKPSDNTPEDKNTPTYITEYEYKQSYVEDVVNYICPNGYVKQGNRCYRETSSSVKPTVTTTYTCPTGYTKSGTKCIKNGSKTIDAKVTTKYSCDTKNGYVAVGTGANTKCYKTTSSTKAAYYNEALTCPAGYQLFGYGLTARCVKTTKYNYRATQVSNGGSCPSGYTKQGNTCVQRTNYIAKCSDGYTYSNGTCVKTVTVGTPSSKCPSGYEVYGSTCVAKNYTSSAVKTSYTCSSGKLEGSQCKVTRSKATTLKVKEYMRETYKGCTYSGYTPDKCGSSNCSTGTYTYNCPAGSSYYTEATKTYSCASGYSSKGTSGSSTKCYATTSKRTTSCSSGTLSSDGKSCVKTETNSSKFNPTCPAGYSKSGSGYNTVCSKTAEYIEEVDQVCPYGGELNGDYCYVENTETIMPNKNINYYCDYGYTLSGSTCYKTTDEYKAPSVNTSYSCAEGTLSGSKCVMNTTDSKNATVNTTYTCPKGYTKYGENANTICTKGKLEYIDVTKSSSQVTKYRYQWSTKTSIPGWERTGKTRQTKTSSK